METASAQVAVKAKILEVNVSVAPKAGYSELWELASDGIYRYRPTGTYYYRPFLSSGKRTHRSLKTKNLKIAKERYMALCTQNGHAAGRRETPRPFCRCRQGKTRVLAATKNKSKIHS